jgi:hypothetical protein
VNKKAFLAVLVCAFLASSLVLKMANAQTTIPTPSVPEFTLKLVEHPYDVSPATTIDPYTGKNTTTRAGYQVENKSIEITIKNQPYEYSFNRTPYHLYYNFRTKGHFEENWTEFYPLVNGLAGATSSYLILKMYISAPAQSGSQYTILTYPVDSPPNADSYPPNAQIDFQVQTIVGHNSQRLVGGDVFFPLVNAHYEAAIEYDISSDWSSTQTITLPTTSSSASPIPSPSPSPSPTVEPTNQTASPTPIPNNYSDWVPYTVIALAIVLGVSIVVYFMKRKSS